MDAKSCYSSGNSSSSSSLTSTSNRDEFLRHLNKLSHKISKPTSSTSSALLPRPPPPHPPPLQPQPQPPVYNINKSDFRHVVQKLTGSPAHSPAPAPIHAPRPSTSRLHRIRPPPLVQLPPPGAGGFLRPPPAPLSPLPPLPSCHGAAESPVSAYMRLRFLHNSIPTAINPHPINAPPSSPLQFGCLLSPKSPCALLSPNLLFSPAGNNPLGFPQLPVSPTVPGVPSPDWRNWD